MAQMVKDSFLDLERHRQLLEENIEKLRKSLRHWQMWEAEYEGLKEEILSAKTTPDHAQLIAIGQQYGGELVTKKEVDDILGLNTSRSAAQVVNILDRRIDYVEQNVRTVQKQIDAADEKLAAATVISTPGVMNEEGLPLTEIVEELDDDDNVITSRLNTPGSAKPQLLEILEKAGIKDLPGTAQPDNVIDTSPSLPTNSTQKNASTISPEKKTVSLKENDNPRTEASKKKGVKFTDDTKSGPEQQKSNTAKRIEGIMNLAKQQDSAPTEPPIIPTDDSPEDATLRREMLQYGMSEIGSVVAELDLEDGSEWSDEEFDEEEDESTDDEDEFGRSTGRVVDDEMRRQMMELEERLGVRMMENIGHKASDYDVVEEGIGRISISGEQNPAKPKSALASSGELQADNKHGSTTGQDKKKSVKFSEELDISPAPTSSDEAIPSTIPRVAPVSDIIERNTPTQITTPTTQKKPSRFKSGRPQTTNIINGPLSTTNSGPSLHLQPAKPLTPKPFSTPIIFTPSTADNPRTVPTGPEGQILSSSIIERKIAPNAVIPEPDELDPHLLNQEVATEYHKLRNRMIQRQGGFMREEESEIVPFTEEEGGPRKLSRFKAARLAKS